MFRSVLTLGVLLAALAPLAGAEDAKKEAPGADKKATLKTDSEAYESASAIDFAAVLALPFPSLTTLGSRIETARRAGDPVGLAAAANELSVAEKVSGKKASLTCEALAKEAADLATLRGHSSELKAVALMAKGDGQKKLTMLAKKAASDEAEAVKKAALGDAERGIDGRLSVRNHTHHSIAVFANGRRLGFVNPNGHAHFFIGDRRGETRLFAEGGGRRWHQDVRGGYRDYDWTLNR